MPAQRMVETPDGGASRVTRREECPAAGHMQTLSTRRNGSDPRPFAASVRPEGDARGKRINDGMSRRNELQ